jgi:Uma2 family endonuclease
MSAQAELKTQYFSEDEYLARERASLEKHEFVNGQIFAMAGASPRHNDLAGAIYYLLYSRLRGSGCVPRISDQRLKVEATGMLSYPDVLVACAPLRYDESDAHTLVDATVIVEVLSPSTQQFDRSGKFLHFQRLPSLRHYVLVSQDQVAIEHRRRVEGEASGAWTIEVLAALTDSLDLDAIGCVLPVAEIYERLDIAADALLPPPELR